MRAEIETLLSTLNEPQKQAVLHTQGPLVVFAGAGSGKTRVITSRISYLLMQQVSPLSILAVTFTNKAAKEMRERVERFSPEARFVLISTFHSACVRWLREFAHLLGYTSQFTIYDESDAKSAINRIMKELMIKDQDHSAQEYRHAIKQVKNKGLTPGEVHAQSRDHAGLFPEHGMEVYRRYQELLATSNSMDFDDLLMNMITLLKTQPQVRDTLRKRYRYILVDEYQDTNPAQFALISLLVNDERNLFVVGDDDQSIYSWRGADPSNILGFQDIFPGAQQIYLEQNYRSSSTIIQAASALILHNQSRAKKHLWTANHAGAPIEFHLEYEGEMEAWWLAEKIQKERNIFEYPHVAVFYRTNAQSRILEDSLRKQGIPYRLFGAVKFYDRAEIKDIVAYFRLLVNENDDVAFKRVTQVPTRGLGEQAVAKLEAFCLEQNCSLMVAARACASMNLPRISGKWMEFVALIDRLQKACFEGSLSNVVEYFLQAVDYKSYLIKKFPDKMQEKLENIYELGSALALYEEQQENATLVGWLQDISLLESVENSEEDDSKPAITLMTLHAAKGLEFKRVYIVGVEDGLIPHTNSLEDPLKVEEERRLFYVGITRAREKLTLSAARKRKVFNKWSSHAPSRFLKELPEALVTMDPFAKRLLNRMGATEEIQSQDQEDTSADSMASGQMIYHPTFGKGKIVQIEDHWGLRQARVEFHEFGTRTVSLEHLNPVRVSWR